MARQLGFQLAQFIHDFLVSPSFASLPLQRADLAFHLADGVFQSQEVLLGIVQLAQGFLFLLLEFGDARCFLKYLSALKWSALDDLGYLALRHDAVAIAADARAHEQLLHVAQAARHVVEKIFATAITKNSAGHGHFRKAQVHPGGFEVFLVHVANGNGHLGHAGGLATARAVGAAENDIRHF